MIYTQYHFAHSVPKQPLVPGLVGQEGKGTHQEKVGSSQVQEAHVSHAAESHATSNDPDDQGVAQEAQQEERNVEGWKKGGPVTLIHTPPIVTVRVVRVTVVIIGVFCGVYGDVIGEGRCCSRPGEKQGNKARK